MQEHGDALALIEAHRAEIDRIDEQLLRLLEQRAGESLAIRALKPQASMSLHDPAREDRIIERLQALSDGPLRDEDIRRIYENLLVVMRGLPS